MMLSPSHNHLHKQEQKVNEVVSHKPKVSINFVSKIHNNSNTVIQNNIVRNNITFTHPSQQPVNRAPKTRNN